MSESRWAPPRAEAGAVNAIWLVVVMILWLATMGLLYFTNADIARLTAAELEARRALADLRDNQFDSMRSDYSALSQAVGYRDTSVVGAQSDVATIRAETEGIKQLLGDALGGDDAEVSLEQSVKALLTAYQAAQTAEADASAAFERERAARAAAEQNVASIESNYKNQVAQLQRQLSQEQQRADTQSANDNRRFDDLIAQQKAAEADARTARQDFEQAERKAKAEALAAAATIKSLELRRLPKAPEAPDGKVLLVSDGLETAWIDVGRNQGLREGTRFELLRRDSKGELVSRGTVEVREVDSSMAMVAVLGKVNPFDPMLPGDLVRNPHFEKGQSLRFHLLGQFPLSLSKEFVGQRLAELGAAVDDEISTSTDVLVLGEKNLAEGEFADELTESDEYQLADKLGIRIMRLDDLAGYLRY